MHTTYHQIICWYNGQAGVRPGSHLGPILHATYPYAQLPYFCNSNTNIVKIQLTLEDSDS